jgi:hypothetical protein
MAGHFNPWWRMTVLGGRLTDQTGRSTGRRKTNKRTKIGGPFVPHQFEMLESPAWRAASLSCRRVVDRVEIELGRHGGVDNGRLPVTHQNFSDFGIDGHSIAPGIREAVALGILTVTKADQAGHGELVRRPNLFGLTYISVDGDFATNDWRRIQTKEEAERLVREARKPVRRKRRIMAAPAAEKATA